MYATAAWTHSEDLVFESQLSDHLGYGGPVHGQNYFAYELFNVRIIFGVMCKVRTTFNIIWRSDSLLIIYASSESFFTFCVMSEPFSALSAMLLSLLTLCALSEQLSALCAMLLLLFTLCARALALLIVCAIPESLGLVGWLIWA